MARLTRRAFLSSAALPVVMLAQGKTRLRRSDSFFGVHFDLHPNGSDTILGRDLTEAMVERLIDRVAPDHIQYDCKGHPGWLGYPSSVSRSAPGIVKDSLAIYRSVTARRGVGLYVHFS